MRVNSAFLCLDCDEIYNGEECPVCFSKSSYPLRKWLAPLHTFAEIKEVRKHDIPLQTKSEGSLCVTTGHELAAAIDAIATDTFSKRFHSRNKGRVIEGGGVKPSKPWPRQGDYPSGERVESESSFKSWCDRINASAAKFFGMAGRLLKRGFEVSGKEHNSRHDDTQTLPENVPKFESGVGKVFWERH